MTIREYFVQQGIIANAKKQRDSRGNLSVFAVKPEWDIYEIALVVETCSNLMVGENEKSAIISKLADSLRQRAIIMGRSKVAVFCNENEISILMTKIEYLLTDGEDGIPCADSLCREIVSMKKKSPKLYNKILIEALRQIQVFGDLSDSKPNNKKTDTTPSKELAHLETNVKQDQSTEQSENLIDEQKNIRRSEFRRWIENNAVYKGIKIEPIISAIDNSSSYVVKREIHPVSFWEMSSQTEFLRVSSGLLEIKAYKVKLGNFIKAYRLAFEIYAQYLKDIEDSTENESDGDGPIPES